MKKIILCIILTSLMIVSNSTYATVQDPAQIGNGWVDSDIKNSLGGTWANISIVVQILAIGCMVFAGVRYMFTSADQRADIKHGMKNLAIGAILVFVTVPVIRLVTLSVSRLIDPSLPSDDYQGNVESSDRIVTADGSLPDRVLMGEVITGDQIIRDGYIYVYNCRKLEGQSVQEKNAGEPNGWGVFVQDNTKTEYPDIVESIYDMPVIYFDYAFANCTNMTKSPRIPQKAVSLERYV